MRKVKLHFTLIGNSYEWKRYVSKEVAMEWTNSDIQKFIVDTTSGYFGNRAIEVMDKESLQNTIADYPPFYCAGWFVSEDNEEQSELVVIGHGDTMSEANESMINYVQSLDWNNLSARI